MHNVQEASFDGSDDDVSTIIMMMMVIMTTTMMMIMTNLRITVKHKHWSTIDYPK